MKFYTYLYLIIIIFTQCTEYPLQNPNSKLPRYLAEGNGGGICRFVIEKKKKRRGQKKKKEG